MYDKYVKVDCLEQISHQATIALLQRLETLQTPFYQLPQAIAAAWTTKTREP